MFSHPTENNDGVDVLKILMVEDEAGLVKVLQAYLKKEGYWVRAYQDGKTGLEAFYTFRPHLLILDLMLPGMSGEEMTRRIREDSQVPIIMLTAKGAEEEKLEGLGLGADDYLVKPVSPREVTARVKTVLRRMEQSSGRVQQDIIRKGPLTIDTFSHKVYRKVCQFPNANTPPGNIETQEVPLTPTEYRIIKLLAQYPQKVFSRENLADQVFGYLWEGDLRSVDAHIKNLRRKLETNPRNPSLIKTVFGVGYQWGSLEEEKKGEIEI